MRLLDKLREKEAELNSLKESLLLRDESGDLAGNILFSNDTVELDISQEYCRINFLPLETVKKWVEQAEKLLEDNSK